MGVGESKRTSEAEVVNVALANSGTGYTLSTIRTVIWIPRDGIKLGGRIIVHAGILLEIDASRHGTTCSIRTVTRGQEDVWVKQRAALLLISILE